MVHDAPTPWALNSTASGLACAFKSPTVVGSGKFEDRAARRREEHPWQAQVVDPALVTPSAPDDDFPARRKSTDYVPPIDLPEIEQRLRELVASIPEPGRAAMLRILTIRDDAKRVTEIGYLYRSGVLPQTAELLIDAEEQPALRATLVGMIREIQT
jgi:hypothetical protein